MRLREAVIEWRQVSKANVSRPLRVVNHPYEWRLVHRRWRQVSNVSVGPSVPGLRAWAHEAFELDAARTRAQGGVDAELHVRRIRMRLACLEVWALLAVPLACVYALDPKKCGWLPERREVEEEPCSGENPCCGWDESGSANAWSENSELIEANCEEQKCRKSTQNPNGDTYEPCCDMLGINYDAIDWSMMFDYQSTMIPRCSSDWTAACQFESIYNKCQELKLSGKECEPICLVTVKRAGWGRARSPGFDRISLENVMCREGNTATWQLWLAILALYLGHWAAYRIVDAHDEEDLDAFASLVASDHGLVGEGCHGAAADTCAGGRLAAALRAAPVVSSADRCSRVPEGVFCCG